MLESENGKNMHPQFSTAQALLSVRQTIFSFLVASLNLLSLSVAFGICKWAIKSCIRNSFVSVKFELTYQYSLSLIVSSNDIGGLEEG